MPNQHAETRQAVTYRLPRELLAAARTRAGERGETMTAVIERALAEYVAPDRADALTTSPAHDQRPPSADR